MEMRILDTQCDVVRHNIGPSNSNKTNLWISIIVMHCLGNVFMLSVKKACLWLRTCSSKTNEDKILDTLTHLPLDKMATTLTYDNLKYNFINDNDRIQIQILLKFVPRSPIDNKLALVRVMAWCWRGDKPLPEPMLTQFTDIYAALGGDELKKAVTILSRVIFWFKQQRVNGRISCVSWLDHHCLSIVTCSFTST